MILEQLQIAPEIVRIAFAAMFALALGLALAFGLGGRTVAQKLLEDAYSKGREHKGQMKSDMQRAKSNTQEGTPGQAPYAETAALRRARAAAGGSDELPAPTPRWSRESRAIARLIKYV